MNREQFDELVRRVEKQFAGRPAALRRRVVAMAIMGYAGLLAWLVIILIISAGFFALMLWADPQGRIACGIVGTLTLIGGGYAALRILLVRVPGPEGRPLNQAEAPELFRMIEDLQAQMRCPAFDQVLIEPACNAAVSQVPRFGVFGWPRNYLLIGLLLMEGFSSDEMRAVLAHELAHLSRQHGRLTHWLYRLRLSWRELFKQLSTQRSRGKFSMRRAVNKFVEWFWPRFDAHAFVLSRANEYEADARSAELAGNQNAISALARLDIVSRHLEQKLWPAILQLANDQPEPPDDVFQRLRDGIVSGPSPEETAKWFGEGLQMLSTNSDTHPSLTERLRALGVERAAGQVTIHTLPPVHLPNPTSAADALLGPSLHAVRADVQKFWRADIAPKWRERYGRSTALRDRLGSLEQPESENSADADRLWDEAVALLDLQQRDSATDLLRQVLDLRPDHAPAHFHLGRLLLQDKGAEGVEHLERAMGLDEQSVPQACSLLLDHFRSSGQKQQMREIASRMDRFEMALQASQTELREISARDKLLPHGLTEPELESLRRALFSESRLFCAHLARKELRHFSNQRLFLLCVRSRKAWHGFPNREADRTLVNRLSQTLRLPGRVVVFSPGGSFRAMAKKLTAFPGAEVFQR